MLPDQPEWRLQQDVDAFYTVFPASISVFGVADTIFTGDENHRSRGNGSTELSIMAGAAAHACVGMARCPRRFFKQLNQIFIKPHGISAPQFFSFDVLPALKSLDDRFHLPQHFHILVSCFQSEYDLMWNDCVYVWTHIHSAHRIYKI